MGNWRCTKYVYVPHVTCIKRNISFGQTKSIRRVFTREGSSSSTDPVIKQTLMRYLRTTRRQDRMTGSHKVFWLPSNPSCTKEPHAMQVNHCECHHQHRSRCKKLIYCISSSVAILYSTDAGFCVADDVNVDTGITEGQKIQDGMLGYNILEYIFKREYQDITMVKKFTVRTCWFGICNN